MKQYLLQRYLMRHCAKSSKGFTLAELLIALAILGVIATFTIPKILGSSQNGQNTAIFKEAMSMVSGAMQTELLSNGVAITDTTAADLAQHMNYVSMASAAGVITLNLHNGGQLAYTAAEDWDATTDYMAFTIDPDGSGTQPATGIALYFNGRVTTGDNITTGTTAGGIDITAIADGDYATFN